MKFVRENGRIGVSSKKKNNQSVNSQTSVTMKIKKINSQSVLILFKRWITLFALVKWYFNGKSLTGMCLIIYCVVSKDVFIIYFF